MTSTPQMTRQTRFLNGLTPRVTVLHILNPHNLSPHHLPHLLLLRLHTFAKRRKQRHRWPLQPLNDNQKPSLKPSLKRKMADRSGDQWSSQEGSCERKIH